MGGRDHSEKCDKCGYQRGGLNDLLCACDDLIAEMLKRMPRDDRRGIRSSYDLHHDPDRQFASVREIPVPTVVVVDEVTGVLRCRWERVA